MTDKEFEELRELEKIGAKRNTIEQSSLSMIGKAVTVNIINVLPISQWKWCLINSI